MERRKKYFEPANDVDFHVSSAVYYIVADQQQSQDNYRFAPNTANSLYVKLDDNNLRSLLSTATDPRASRYVSVSLLIRMQKKLCKIDWHRENMKSTFDHEPIEKQKDFLLSKKYNKLYLYQDRTDYAGRGDCCVPIRKEDGEFEMLRATDNLLFGFGDWYEKYMRLWANIIPNLLKTSLIYEGKPPRTVDFKLDNGLNIVINQTGYDRFGENTKKVFEECIAEAESGYTTKLFLREEDYVDNMVKLSCNPFDLYTTFIHADDWDTYMRSLSAQADLPIRSFPWQSTEEMDRVNEVVENRNVIGSELAMKWRWLSEPELPSVRRARMRMDTKFWQTNTFSPYCSLIWLELSAQKIRRAIDTRTQEDTQKQVMGVSAPALAKSLGWRWKGSSAETENRMKNGLYIAEWLHLGAYSFGGFLSHSVKDQGATSQIPENLVLGTSETNSLMTRSEYAWQRLIKDEEIIWNPAQGKLEIVTNQPNIPLYYDNFNNNRYEVSKANSIEDSFVLFQNPHGTRVTSEEMRQTAERYKFIAYSISWGAQLFGWSDVLGRENPFMIQHFFPFMRPFFHKVEESLDSQLYKYMTKHLKKRSMEIES